MRTARPAPSLAPPIASPQPSRTVPQWRWRASMSGGPRRKPPPELKRRRAAGTRRRRVQRQDIDSLAAAIILGRWLRGEY